MTQPADRPASPACSRHPSAAATHRCGFCDLPWCDLCIEVKRLSDQSTARVCRTCGGACVELGVAAPVSEPRRDPLRDLLRDLVCYPLRDHGFIQVGGAGVLLGLVAAGGGLGSAGVARWLGALVALAYVWAFLFRVVGASANGSPRLPDWPDLLRTDLSETLWHAFCARFLVTWPALAYELFVLRHGHGSQAIYYALEGLGALLLPMVMLAVILHETPAAIDPRLILPAIRCTARAYLPLAVAFWGVNEVAEAAASGLVGWVSDLDLDWINPFRLLVLCVAGTLRAWALVVTCRLLGLFYRAHAARLGWFELPSG